MIDIYTNVAMPTQAQATRKPGKPAALGAGYGVQIDSGIAQQPAPAARRKARKGGAIIRTPKAVANALAGYVDAYRAVYEVAPTVSYDGTWIRIHGQTQGVSLQRLKEMTTQLKYRAG